MAESIVSTRICSDLLIDVAPELEDRSDIEIRALSALLQPALDLVASAYRTAYLQASVTAKTKAAFRQFLQCMIEEGD